MECFEETPHYMEEGGEVFNEEDESGEEEHVKSEDKISVFSSLHDCLLLSFLSSKWGLHFKIRHAIWETYNFKVNQVDLTNRHLISQYSEAKYEISQPKILNILITN